MITSITPNRTLRSAVDKSVNFVWDLPDNGALEARFVRREEDYFIVYLSSQSGCNQSCRFCHLTATKQVMFDQATLDDYLIQARTVLDYYDAQVAAGSQTAARRVNFNWMARGEPLLNPVVTGQTEHLYGELSDEAAKRGLTVHFNMSSIIPEGVDERTLRKVLDDPRARMYYSLYSLNPEFRKRWLPKAKDPLLALDMLARIQQDNGRDIALHWAFIEGENDDVKTAEDIVLQVTNRALSAKFNLVRYNPYSERQGRESNEQVLDLVFNTLKTGLHADGTRIVPRVGFDVKASCGMFVHPAETNN